MGKNKLSPQFKNILDLVGESHSFKHRCLMVSPDLTLLGINESCGDKITLQLKLKNQKIKQALFSGESCSLSALGAEAMCLLLEKEKNIKSVTEKNFLQYLNFNFSPARKKCAYLVWKTWQNYVSSPNKQIVQIKAK